VNHLKQSNGNDPLWYKDAIIYELHVRTFFDGNNDGIGDFAGLIQKLDYLQTLGVTCLWLLPFFPSPLRDDGYDIADYTSVHPSYGTLEDFQTFLKAAHERNLQVMIELVINHTSDQHPWFQAARSAPPGSELRNFYVWSDTDRKYDGVRIIFTDTEKSNWSWDPVAGQYYWHRFFSHQPDLNYDHPAVLEEVRKVMRFWLDLGVDGLRLDAIPYLVERDGTNCENLPETHAIIKEIRRDMSERYADRMILAEANQWPTDVRAYFGDGDECHMAFHFPLMPRLFMALRLEDRHPITDIIAQTPDIPENCQWGLFLRNHDELTLEMVTDDERDYMYLAYSADRQMRVNIGIRRRLAPLMENNRRRIELLNSLLFSFPGTPILYYGDELGMGDNVYLGDRNGVRTPMQWSADRNAGFSRSNPARLYSPVIMDPIYGYEALNVEAQMSDSSSLLNWTRHMIALRKLFKTFGRGSIEFFHPANRKVLAYLRRWGDEQILCIANLSRFAQPVELDLSSLAGLTPVEMLGYVEFPKIGRAPYLLTLGPYGFLWFELHGVLDRTNMDHPFVENLVVKTSRWESILEGSARAMLEQQLLPVFLQKKRWFGGKSHDIERIHIKNWSHLKSTAAVLTLIDVTSGGGAAGTYFLPLSLAVGDAAAAIRKSIPEAILSPFKAGAESGVLYDAAYDDEFCRALLSGLRENAELRTGGASIRFESGIALKEWIGEDGNPISIRRILAEQSNTSIVFGDRFILKLFRRVEAGINPDCEIGRYLSDRVGFDGVPKFGGAIEFRPLGSEAISVAMMQAMVANLGDAWTWTLEELARFYEKSSTEESPGDVTAELPSVFELSQTELPPEFREQIGIYYDAATILGRKTAELHLALATPTDNADFAAEPFSLDDRQQLTTLLRRHATSVFDLLKDNLARLPDELVEQASLLLSLRRKVWMKLGRIESLELNFDKIRIHGDYHLGQVLRLANDYRILDFEGEPARSLDERRARQSPLKDVAGMLRSFSYAAYAGLFAHAARRPDGWERLEFAARQWGLGAAATFLRSYRSAAGSAAFLPSSEHSFRNLLEIFLLDKALYELSYEMNNRPTWVRIPLRGILSLGWDNRNRED
jgi:maltose alpha-D-glucosyltransferase/alpha-amylase